MLWAVDPQFPLRQAVGEPDDPVEARGIDRNVEVVDLALRNTRLLVERKSYVGIGTAVDLAVGSQMMAGAEAVVGPLTDVQRPPVPGGSLT